MGTWPLGAVINHAQRWKLLYVDRPAFVFSVVPLVVMAEGVLPRRRFHTAECDVCNHSGGDD